MKSIVLERLKDCFRSNPDDFKYQALAGNIRRILGEASVREYHKYEEERLQYILSKLDIRDKCVVDIGSNAGYFAFELLDAGARKVICYEGIGTLTQFMQPSADALGVTDRVDVRSELFDFSTIEHSLGDVALLLNVIHHFGRYYGDAKLSMEEAKKGMIEQLNAFSKVAPQIVFQLGFNWKGDPHHPLFKEGTKAEMIEFISNGISDTWEIKHAGIARKDGDTVYYEDFHDSNMTRDDTLGEFLNRPLFILQRRDKQS